MLSINFNEVYQLFYLKKAINELVNKNNKNNKINAIMEPARNGCNYINNIKTPLIFPIYLLDYINKLNKNKEIDYNFVGTIIPHRNWIKKKKYQTHNSIIKSSNYGRDPKKKYEIDKEYYDIMCKSKFTLTPTGDCPWSYRFFEAIMCLSIPILEDNSNDIYMKDYFCFFDKDEHFYDINMAIKNYNTFINSKHFLKNIKELDFLFTP